MTDWPVLKGKFFVTGTNTNVGKTWVSARLLEAARDAGHTCYGIKPLAAGCEETPEGLRNEDALALDAAASVKLPYEQLNPVALKEPVAPHILVQQQKLNLNVSRLTGYVRGAIMTHPADLVLVEGAGGWRVPVNDRETLADLARELDFPVILVVGMELGCLNHSLLTAEAIQRDGLKLAGWVANFLRGDMERGEENFRTLQSLLPAPCLARTDRS
jgi:dethiobiotin synthetase